MYARVMPDRNLRDGEPMHERERGKKSMHALEEADAFEHGPPEYFERTSSIVDTVVGKEVPHTVGDSGRHFFHQAILPFLPPSAHEIVGVSIGEEFQNVLAVLLKIAVDLNNDFSRRLTETRFKCAGLAIISIQVEYPNLGVLRRQAI